MKQDDIIKETHMLIERAQRFGGNNDYLRGLSVLNEAIGRLIWFLSRDKTNKEVNSMLFFCFFTSGQYQFELKNYSSAIEHFISAKLFTESKDETRKLNEWIEGCIDEYEFLIDEKVDKMILLKELEDLRERLDVHSISIGRIDKIISELKNL